MSNIVKGFKVHFDFLIKKVHLAVGFPCQLQVQVKRGSQKIMSRGKYDLNLEEKSCVFQEQISMFASVYLSQATNNFLEKKVTFTVVIITPKGERVVGKASYNLADLLNKKKDELEEVLSIQNCPDKKAKINILFKQKVVEELADIDTISQMTRSPPTSVQGGDVAAFIQEQQQSLEAMKKQEQPQQQKQQKQQQQSAEKKKEGGNIKGFKVKFDFNIQKINLAVAFPCQLQVQVKRGTQKILSNGKYDLDTEKKECIFNETISLFSSIYLNMTSNKFMEKTVSFTTIIITPKGERVVGAAKFDLAELLNKKLEDKIEILPIQKCPDKKAKITIQFQQKVVEELPDIDTMSQMTRSPPTSVQSNGAAAFFAEQQQSLEGIDQKQNSESKKKALIGGVAPEIMTKKLEELKNNQEKEKFNSSSIFVGKKNTEQKQDPKLTQSLNQSVFKKKTTEEKKGNNNTEGGENNLFGNPKAKAQNEQTQQVNSSNENNLFGPVKALPVVNNTNNNSQEVQMLKKKLLEKENQIENKTKEADYWKKQAENMKKQLEEGQKNSKAEMLGLKKQILELQKQNMEVSQNMEGKDKKTEQIQGKLKEELTNLKQLYENLQSENEKLQKQLSQKSKESQGDSQDQKFLKQQIVKLENKLQNIDKDYEEQMNEKEQDLEELEQENKSLSSQTSQQKKRIQDLEVENKNQSNMIEMLKKQFKGMEIELVKSKQKIGDAINTAFQYGGPELVDQMQTVLFS